MSTHPGACFIPTQKQLDLLALLSSDATNILAYGGARSGKTALLCEAIIYRARMFPRSRHLVARLHYNHARTSLLHESFTKALEKYPRDYEINKSDSVIFFKNGSEIWVGGFDDSDRTEKILGHEYCTVYFNEISQISYDTMLIGKTRLAQNIPGCKNKAYYDCNPPSPLHWAYKLFIQKVEPKSGEPLARPELYKSIKMNPTDNVENLPEDYIENNLATLPEHQRARFLYGEWVKSEGVIYDKFDESMIIKADKVPAIEHYRCGVDFGLNSTAILIGFSGDNVYVCDEIGMLNQTASKLNAEMRRKWADKNYIAYCDPAGGERLQEISRSEEANNSVEPGINMLCQKMEHGQFFVVEHCRGVLDEIASYRRDEKERVVKENDHYMDAMRYGVFSYLSNRGGGVAWVG